MESEATNKAIENLWLKRIYQHKDEKYIIAFLLRSDDYRPLDAPWWKGKEVNIIGADINGNFFLRHCDGSVRYWDHTQQKDEIISPSVRDFMAGLNEE